MKKKYCYYLRVSTQKQGRTGLGLDAQRKMCDDFIAQQHGEKVAEYTDVESGTHRDRKGLWQAIEYCKLNNATLVVAKLDRLARDVEFTFKVINTGIDIHFVDMPMVNTMILGVFASVAQYERELISQRTKAALKQKIEKGGKVGAASDKYNLTKEQRQQRQLAAGATRTMHSFENRDTQIFMKIMKQVYPECATHPESEWTNKFVTAKFDYRIKFLQLMSNYKEIDNDLFKSWDLSDIMSDALTVKFTAKLQSVIRNIENYSKQQGI